AARLLPEDGMKPGWAGHASQRPRRAAPTGMQSRVRGVRGRRGDRSLAGAAEGGVAGVGGLEVRGAVHRTPGAELEHDAIGVAEVEGADRLLAVIASLGDDVRD